MASTPDKLFVCKNTFVFEVDGVLEAVRQGAVVRAGHPIMDGREDMFAPIHVDYEVEAPAPAKAKPLARR